VRCQEGGFSNKGTGSELKKVKLFTLFEKSINGAHRPAHESVGVEKVSVLYCRIPASKSRFSLLCNAGNTLLPYLAPAENNNVLVNVKPTYCAIVCH
jgi:hypothetical protein